MRCIVVGIAALGFLICLESAHAQNPFILDQFTADPTARVFEGRMYVYPSHDVNCGTDWFCMKDYHVFSSENLLDWTDHGVIVTQEKVAWVDSSRNAMWAPDAVERNGRYYFYFPAIVDTNTGLRGMRIGVATSDSPSGPFIPEPMPITGIFGIDPNIFIDDDGQAYIYWAGGGQIVGAKLKENMLELDSEPVVFSYLPSGMKEGPFLFKRDGIYYLTFPRVIEKTEALVYATGDNPLGPFDYQGIIMDEHPSGCWTNHHSIVQYQDQWYLFYHHNDLSPHFDKNRSIRVDSLFFNADGTIPTVTPTLRGVGVVPATREIQLDRYSAISATGADVSFIDSTDTFAGWKTTLTGSEGWIRFDRVDFGEAAPRYVYLKARSADGGSLGLQIGSTEAGSTVSIDVPAGEDWQMVRARVERVPSGIHDLRLAFTGGGRVDVDWIRFE